MRPRMNWQRWRRHGPWSPRTSSPETSTSLPLTTPWQQKRAHRLSPPQGPRPPLSPRPLRPSPRSWKSTRSLPRPTRARTGEARSLIASLEESFLQTGPKPTACATSQNVRPQQRRVVQAKPIWRPPTMHHHRGRPSPTLGLARGSLRAPCCTSDARRKCLPPRVLLANGGCRRHQAGTLLRGMPVLCAVDAPPSPSPLDHPHYMAIRRVGAGHGWASAEGPRGPYPFAGSY